MKRIVATVVAAALAFFMIVSPAHADGDDAANAASWIAEQETDDVGMQADQVIALASVQDPQYDARIKELVDGLKGSAKSYIKDSPEGAAKLVIVAVATGNDPSAFGGVNLTSTVIESVRSDGSYGSYPGPFASGLAMVALARSDSDVPASMTSYLLNEPYLRSDGCFTFAEGEDADPDSTSMAILGLEAAKSSDPALAKAQKCLASLQQSNGSFKAYSPVNSTGLAGPLLLDDAREKAKKYVASQQLDNGALTTGTSDKADLLASVQGMLSLTNETYLSVPTGAAPASDGDSDSDSEVADTGSGIALGAVIVAVVAIGVGGFILLRRRRRP